ncbi:hypothetical protein IV203_029262 [Nitzschia inconspicua]|uniref:Uncharacterized protein n=1 Tax=Nitzschia inconspicua TaxID=303405 RepID=A0A9K3LQV5_9STRA|nr:hypothetical protein IV203_029262 [Nitzschia inconspicua]
MTSSSKSEPVRKKTKLHDDDSDEQHQQQQQQQQEFTEPNETDALWKFYENFLNSADGDNDDDNNNMTGGGGGGGGADIDELQELVDHGEKILQQQQQQQQQLQSHLDPSTEDSDPAADSDSDSSEQQLTTELKQGFEAYTSKWKSREDLLPVLMSVAYCNLAEASISEYLMMKTQQQQQQQQQQQSAAASASRRVLLQENGELTIKTAQRLVTKSIEWCPYNANSWSMGGNFGRMSRTLSLPNVALWMERAAITATVVRQRALELLDDHHDDEEEEEETVDDECKHWIELLLLNQMVGAEFEGDEEESDDEQEEEEEETKNETFQNEYDDDEQGKDDDDDDNVAQSECFENEFSEKGRQDNDGNGDGSGRKRKQGANPKKNESFENEFEDKGDPNEDDGAKDDSFENEFNEKDTEEDSNGGEEEVDSPMDLSASAVESTARFMCAMLYSMEGRHDKALGHLKHFRLTHRLHPNVWKPSSTTKDEPSPTAPPLIFQPSGGILPVPLYDAMKAAFAPNATYWFESDYANRGYFSYFMDYNKSKPPQNLLEDVIVHHLLPRAQQCLKSMKEHGLLSEEESTEIQGFEWWAHTRPIQANLGHSLHFDTDEAMLDQEGKVTHPILSSVLYLTGRPDDQVSSPAGATIILDQTPDSKTCAEKCWQGIPRDNSFLLFPGDRLHGVLPCPGKEDDSTKRSKSASRKAMTDCWKAPSFPTDSTPHRLTFMVGFWTRNVPATMKNRRLYGPCGPLPPATEEHTWVQEIVKGYANGNINEVPAAADSMVATPLPCVSPAWEVLESNSNDKVDEPPQLQIPHGIDHRFFVNGAPECFRQSLFEDREADC